MRRRQPEVAGPTTDRSGLLERRDRLAREFGPWRENVMLGDGLYTLDPGPDGVATAARVRTTVQIAADALRTPLAGARVLDLGAGEGTFAIEFARQGSQVVALEAREGNVQKLRFAAAALGLENVDVVKDDVRNLSRERYGEFDVVLCLGLLYHLDGESAVRTARRLAEVCARVAIIDTHVALRDLTSIRIGERTYAGVLQREFDPGASTDEQERLSRSSVGNAVSFWPTRPSLYNLLGDAGFSSLAEAVWPRYPKTADRATIVAHRGARVAAASVPDGGGDASPRWPEREPTHRNARLIAQVRRRLAPVMPASVKEIVRRRRERARQSPPLT